VPERGRLVVDCGGTSIGIFRLDGVLHAYENLCPHAGGPVCQGLMIPPGLTHDTVEPMKRPS
jgi:nitrite reductase/ring-hydroxylating ferredoxin subunit